MSSCQSTAVEKMTSSKRNALQIWSMQVNVLETKNLRLSTCHSTRSMRAKTPKTTTSKKTKISSLSKREAKALWVRNSSVKLPNPQSQAPQKTTPHQMTQIKLTKQTATASLTLEARCLQQNSTEDSDITDNTALSDKDKTYCRSRSRNVATAE